ncbi:MAG: hypothetical protein ACKOC0_09990 [Cytophagales bacterium]
MNRTRTLFTLLLVVASFNSKAQQPLPLKKITIFKNGSCLLTREGKSAIKAGVARLPIPQEVLFGGYWIGATGGNAIQSLTFRIDKLEKKEAASEFWQLISGNVGKTVTISLHNKKDEAVTGKILSFEKKSQMVKLRQENGKITYLQTHNIFQLDFSEEMNATLVEDSTLRMVLLTPEKSANDINLQQLSMQAGVNWVPSYLLKLNNEKSARLEMKAVIENGIEDIFNAETELVVGSPQMYFGKKRDPITYDYLTTDVGADNAGMQPMQTMSNAAYSRTAKADKTEESTFDGSYSTEGEKAGDLYIYKVGKVTLANHAKGSYPVFASNIDYKHKYEGVIADKTNYYNSRFVDSNETTVDVYHSLELKNTTGVPFTTAPVMVITEKEQFLAQDLLKYTPVGGMVDVKLSKAIDIVMRNTEEESQRNDSFKKINSYMYSRVVIKGNINISNLQNTEVTVSVKKLLAGTVLSQSDGGKTLKTGIGYDNNPSSNISWEIKMPVNSKKTLTYEYEVLYRL